MRVFVTRELYPFTAGGIGRVVGNILATSSVEQLRETAVVCVSSEIDRERFQAVYPEVRFLSASHTRYRMVGDDGMDFPPANAYSDHFLHWESVLAMQALLSLEQEVGPLGYIEFPDWGGMAFASCQEKRLGRGFRQATIAVRLHTTDSVLAAVERRLTDIHALALYDIERKALADCDLVVAQLPTVGERVRDFYGFSPFDWHSRLHVHAPPVVLDGGAPVHEAIEVGPDTPITFSSKIQHVKRPDIFVRGCCEFLARHPENRSQVQFLAHAFDSSYLATVMALIPDSLVDRFSFIGGISGAARDRLIARSVCVFPSSWESFCLAAYEASLSGAACVVNAANPAFGDGTPWHSEVNCVSFDGSSAGLADALAQVFAASRRQVPVAVPADSVPWEQSGLVGLAADAQIQQSMEPFVTVVLCHLDDAIGLAASLDSIVGSSYPMIEVLILDRGSEDPVATRMLERLSESVPAVRRVETLHHETLGSTFNRGLGSARGEFVAILESGEVLDPGFLATAVAALCGSADFSAVTGQQRNRSHHLSIAATGAAEGFHVGPGSVSVFHGEARANGLYEDRFAGVACLLRAEWARAIGFRDDMDQDVRWEFHGRAVRSGARYIVSSAVEGTGRPVNGEEADSLQRRIRAHDMLRDKSFQMGAVTLPCYAMAAGLKHEAPVGEAVRVLEARLREYDTSETVFAALTVAKLLQRRVPWLLAASRWSMRTGWRCMKAIRARR